MIQHLLMGDLGALLIVLGLTGPLLQPVLANRWLCWLRHLAHPLVALPLWAIDFYLWHLPFLYQAATDHNSIHALQHACFIGFGVLMWMPLVGPLPQPNWFKIPAKLGYLIGVRFVGIVLGNVFMWSNTVFYPHYAAGEAKWHISAVTDQSLAGVIMMVESTFVTLGVLAWLFLEWAKQDTERQRLLDLADSRGVPLTEARAARAAAAGQGARLEERIKTEGSALSLLPGPSRAVDDRARRGRGSDRWRRRRGALARPCRARHRAARAYRCLRWTSPWRRP